eukprot:3706369-Amphidinium_carterae.1
MHNPATVRGWQMLRRAGRGVDARWFRAIAGSCLLHQTIARAMWVESEGHDGTCASEVATKTERQTVQKEHSSMQLWWFWPTVLVTLVDNTTFGNCWAVWVTLVGNTTFGNCWVERGAAACGGS